MKVLSEVGGPSLQLPRRFPLQGRLGRLPDALGVFPSPFLVHWRLKIEVREIGIIPENISKQILLSENNKGLNIKSKQLTGSSSFYLNIQ